VTQRSGNWCRSYYLWRVRLLLWERSSSPPRLVMFLEDAAGKTITEQT
jgi:hypothetical protein